MSARSGRCGRCGAPTRPQSIKGLQALVCVSCGAVTVDQGDLQQLEGGVGGTGPMPAPLSSNVPTATPHPGGRSTPAPAPPPVGAKFVTPNEPRMTGAYLKASAGAEPSLGPALTGMDDDAFDRQLRLLRERKRRRTLIAVVLMLSFAVVLLAVPLSYSVYRAVTSFGATDAPTVPVPPDLGQVLDPAPAPDPPTDAGTASDDPPTDAVAVPTDGSADPEPSAAPDPAPAPDPEPAPEPSAAPTPKPPPRPSGSSYNALIQKGWNQVGSNAAAAATTFKRALDQKPKDPEANYGYGYALMQQGNLDGARTYLCIAASGNDIEVNRDVKSLLSRNNLTCN